MTESRPLFCYSCLFFFFLFFSSANFTLSLSLNCSFVKKETSGSKMEQYPSDDKKEVIKDQQREGYCKEACEFDTSERFSDEIVPHILNLYGSCATPHDFEIYAPDATFEDPLMCAHGIKQIKSAFYSLSKVFSESKIVEYSIKENVVSPGKGEILIDNKQYYKFLGRDINMISLIKLSVEERKIVRHEDCWDKKPLLNKETAKMSLLGRIVEISRRGSMMATHAMMRFGKDPTV
ncbi:uncharacterized protein LOC132311794 [Cornus florida]|uniref:uncharacterized protein LOC132311794 n=1 Tax=Cornus florida TaxID=4283 RepID=UPI002898BCAC|nr:uncharacterized protein LOC132311794 [Cornus florida]